MHTRSCLRRLRDVDAALASRKGLDVAEIAARHGVSVKTVRRDVAALRGLVGPTDCHEIETEDGRAWRHFYRFRGRLFR